MQVNAGRLWFGGFVTSVLAGVAGVIVFSFATQVLSIELLVESPISEEVDSITARAVFGLAFGAGILASATLHLFLRFVPRPTMFFGLASLLVFLASLLAPLTMATTDVATGWLLVTHFVVFLVIVGPLLGVARSSASPAMPLPARMV
ncbi:MAG: DUF6069 family protein [Acidimicrobiia bacterium]